MTEDDSHRVLFEMGYYSDNKDAVKAPIKELGLSWQFIGQEGGTTKGRYTGDEAEVFVQYSDEYADFTVSGDDEAVETILDAWSDMETVSPDADEAPASPLAEAQRKKVRIWKFKEPTRRPGEPEALFERRLEAWKEDDPRE